MQKIKTLSKSGNKAAPGRPRGGVMDTTVGCQSTGFFTSFWGWMLGGKDGLSQPAPVVKMRGLRASGQGDSLKTHYTT